MQHALKNMQGQKLFLHILFQLYAKGAPRPPLSHYPRQEIAVPLHINVFCNSSLLLFFFNFGNGQHAVFYCKTDLKVGIFEAEYTVGIIYILRTRVI